MLQNGTHFADNILSNRKGKVFVIKAGATKVTARRLKWYIFVIKSNRKEMSRDWGNQKASTALTKTGNK